MADENLSHARQSEDATPENSSYGDIKNLLSGRMPPPAPVEEEPSTEPEEPSVPAEEEDADPEVEEEVDTEPEVEEEEKEASTDEEPEEIGWAQFTDPETGKRKKVKIDFTNRAHIEQTYARAAGLVPKYQRERDLAKKELSSYLEETTPKLEVLNDLQSAWSEDGIRGVIDLLAGDESQAEEFIDSLLEERDWLKKASPTEKELWEAKQLAKKAEKEKQELLERQQKREQEAEEKAQKAEEAEIRSQLNSSFDKWRFAGRMKDADAAKRFDKIIWREAMEALDGIESEQGRRPTKAETDKVFKESAEFVRKYIRQEAEQTAAKTEKKRKTTAQKKVAAKAKAGNKKANQTADAREDIAKNGLRGLMKSLGA